MVDDSPEKHRGNYGNLVRVAPYFGAVEDDELPRLAAYLEAIADVADYRRLEKRFWHSQAVSVVHRDATL